MIAIPEFGMSDALDGTAGDFGDGDVGDFASSSASLPSTVADRSQRLLCPENAYPLYPEGTYDLRCVRARVYRDPAFKRWTCRLLFQFLDSTDTVYGFLNLGTGAQATIGKRSKFYRAWAKASHVRPRKGARMSHAIFVDKIFRARIRTVKNSYDGGAHGSTTQYSVVGEILERLWP